VPNKVAKGQPDRAIAGIAESQHGVIMRSQLVAAGLLPSGISDRVNAGRLHRIHRGVYAVGHPRLSDEGQWMAAVLACGAGAALSHRSAAELWGMLRARRCRGARWRNDDAPVHVTVPGDGGRTRRRGIRLHRSRSLSPAETTHRSGIPVTNPARTLADLRSAVSETEFARALREAEFLQLPVQEVWRSGRGSTRPTRTRTELEAVFLGLCRRHRLPQPEVNAKVDRFEVDFLWREERLVIEVDGWDAHRSRSAFEEDRRRDVCLKLLGYEVLRFTWRQVQDRPREVAGTLRVLLRR
jgi:very-short-patch-repair endonuclease